MQCTFHTHDTDKWNEVRPERKTDPCRNIAQFQFLSFSKEYSFLRSLQFVFGSGNNRNFHDYITRQQDVTKQNKTKTK